MSVLAMAVLVIGFAGCTAKEPKTLDEQAQEIYGELMCPLCAGQTIDQSSSELSAQMRALVRDMLEKGGTREEILQFFVDRYGEGVLAAPIKSGFNLIVWVAPILVIIIGGVVLWIIIRRRVTRGITVPEEPEVMTEEEAHYEEQLERDLESFEEKGFR